MVFAPFHVDYVKLKRIHVAGEGDCLTTYTAHGASECSIGISKHGLQPRDEAISTLHLHNGAWRMFLQNPLDHQMVHPYPIFYPRNSGMARLAMLKRSKTLCAAAARTRLGIHTHHIMVRHQSTIFRPSDLKLDATNRAFPELRTANTFWQDCRLQGREQEGLSYSAESETSTKMLRERRYVESFLGDMQQAIVRTPDGNRGSTACHRKSTSLVTAVCEANITP